MTLVLRSSLAWCRILVTSFTFKRFARPQPYSWKALSAGALLRTVETKKVLQLRHRGLPDNYHCSAMPLTLLKSVPSYVRQFLCGPSRGRELFFRGTSFLQLVTSRRSKSVSLCGRKTPLEWMTDRSVNRINKQTSPFCCCWRQHNTTATLWNDEHRSSCWPRCCTNGKETILQSNFRKAKYGSH